MGAICWNLLTWWFGIPSSSSHALIGGLAGAGVMKAGLTAIVWSGLGVTAAAIVLSPLLGFFTALLLVLIVSWTFVRSMHRPWTISFALCSWYLPRFIPLGMEEMTRRRRWASLPCCSTRRAS